MQKPFFDGRKDLSLKYQYGRLKIVTKDHISILHVSHVTTEHGDAPIITDTIQDRLMVKNVEMSTIKAIGCDGTDVNVGKKVGVIRLFELSMKTHVQWFVCFD